ERAAAALESGAFRREIVPVEVPGRKKATTNLFERDEFPRPGTTVEKLATLRTPFKKEGGTVTAGNASGLNDGAAATVVMSERRARELGVTPMARIVAHAPAGVEPRLLGVGPVP